MPCLLTLKKACVSIQTPFIIEVYEIHYAPKNEKMLPAVMVGEWHFMGW
jgi:hypothetical protein